MQIVSLNPDTLPYAVGLAKELHAIGTFGRDGPSFDWQFCMGTMQAAMVDPNYYMRLALDDTGYVGAVAGKVTPFYFNPAMLGIEDAWFVREGTASRAAVAVRLMRGFVNWCIDEKGALIVQSGDVAGTRTVGVDALYRRMGFTRFGTIFKYARA